MGLKKLAAMGLVGTMLLGALSGCGGSSDKTDAPSTGSTATENDGGNAGGDSTEGSSDAGTMQDENVEIEEDTAEINIMYIHTGGVTDYVDVEAALNELTLEKINVQVSMEVVGIADYLQQLNLKISSHEKLDALVTIPAGTGRFVSMTSQNQLMPIDDLLEEAVQQLVIPQL